MKGITLRTLKYSALVGVMLSVSGCGLFQRALNPFYEEPSPNAYLGERSDKALNEGEEKIASARAALDSAATYDRAHLPQPSNPVVKPSVVRLMWVPDHLNKSGDLVPAHYYYLKVKSDEWALSDAFELEGQLSRSNGGETSAVPYVLEDK